MGAFNFIWDLHQSDQIDELEKRIKKLEEQNQILYEWVKYLNNQLSQQTSKVSNERTLD